MSDRAKSDTELIRKGAELVIDKDGITRVEVTPQQAEEVRWEMRNYFKAVEEQKRAEILAATSVRETFVDLIEAFKNQDAEAIKVLLFTLAVHFGIEKERHTSDKYDNETFYQRLKEWIDGEELPLAGWSEGKPTGITFEEVLEDKDSAVDLVRIIRGMGITNACLQTVRRDGKVDCRGCSNIQALMFKNK